MRIPLIAVVGAALLAGCTSGADQGDPATWRVEPGTVVDASTTRFTALVSRDGCNSGVTGTPSAPVVEVEEDRVVVTFRALPSQDDAADCLGNDEVPAVVVLGEPLGDRELVDGQVD